MIRWPFKIDVPPVLEVTARLVIASSILFLGVVLCGEALGLWYASWFLVLFFATAGFSVICGVLHRTVHLFEAIKVTKALPGLLVELALLAAMSALFPHPPIVAIIGILRTFYSAGHVLSESALCQKFASSLVENPAKLLVISFGAIILTGTVLLMLPRATDDGKGAPFLVALFTATSATCVTGLTVIPTFRDALVPANVPAFSPFGQAVILALIQVGGLGIMALSTSVVLLATGRFSVRSQAIFQEVADEEGALTLQRMIRHIVTVTLVCETIGALALSLGFLREFPDDWAFAVYCGVFHAVSAFCNAGFSLFSDSLRRFSGDPVIGPVIATLIVLGGLGFMVVTVLCSPSTWSAGFRQGIRRMPTHCKVVLTATLALIVSGALALLLLDANGAQRSLSLGQRIWISTFQSITARTAGFSMIDMGQTSRAAVFAYLFLMFVGASPGGTGGGIKTTSLVLVGAAIRAALTGREKIEVLGRTIPERTVTKAIAISALSLTLCLVTSLLLLAFEKGLSTEQLLFETVSAFGTVGLSLNTTPKLDAIGQTVIVMCMFAGRVGPLTLTLAVMRKPTTREVRYPEGRILVG